MTAMHNPPHPGEVLRDWLAVISFALAITSAPVTAEDRAAPDCPVQLVDGGAATSIAQFHGKVLYVDFWASWCGPCLKSFPFMNELQHDLGDKGLQILAVNMDEKPDDAAKFLAADTSSEGFDNIADSQTLSASMMQGYLRAAAHITSEALGDPEAEAASAVFKANVLASQLRHVPGTPMGTRGGIAFDFNFPADKISHLPSCQIPNLRQLNPGPPG